MEKTLEVQAERKINFEEILEKIGLYALYIFAFSLFVSPALTNVSFALSALPFLLRLVIYRKGIDLKKNKIVLYLLALYFGGALFNIFSEKGISGFISKLDKEHRVILLIILLTFINEKQKLIRFFILLVISFTISFLYGDFLWIENPAVRAHSFSGMMNFSHTLSIGLIFASAFFLNKNITKKVRILSGVIFLVASFSLIITSTRGAWLAFLGGIIIVLLVENYKILIGFLIIVTLVFIFLPSSIKDRVSSISDTQKYQSNTERLALWNAAIWTWKQNIVFGAGTENTEKWFEKYKNVSGKKDMNIYNGNTHNVYLHYLAQNGLFTIFFLLFLWVYIPMQCIKIVKQNILKKNNIYFAGLALLGGVISYYISAVTELVWSSQEPSFTYIILLFFISILQSGKIILENENKEI